MPFGISGQQAPTDPPPEFGTVSLRVEGVEIKTIKEFHLTQHFLTPTDPFRLTLASELTGPEARELLKPGSKVEIFIDEAKQFAGYMEVFDMHTDRHTGTAIMIEGRDTMAPLVEAQIDPDHHYPDKMPLEDLLTELLEPFGFTAIEISNEDNVAVSANLALKQKRGAGLRHRRRRHPPAGKPLKQYPLSKCKPEHNDSYYQFISRILHRQGLWMWPAVDGETMIVGKPNYEQDPIGQLRRYNQATTGGFGISAGVSLDRGATNIESGGIRIDSSEQPSFIVARGQIPARSVSHSKMQIVIDHPLVGKPTRSIADEFRNSAATKDQVRSALLGEGPDFSPPKPPPSLASTAFKFSRTQGGRPEAEGGGVGALRTESGTYSEAAAKASPIYEKLFTYTTKIPAEPVQIPNPFASKISRHKYLTDKASTTPEMLERFARRQMSLFVRKAFVAKYIYQGFYLDGAIPQCDTIVSVIDEPSGFDGNLWVQSRTISQSRESGTRTELELLPLGALSF